jgi:hypothetical protein
LDNLIDDGWATAELEIVKKTWIRMLSVIYDVSGTECDAQN